MTCIVVQCQFKVGVGDGGGGIMDAWMLGG